MVKRIISTIIISFLFLCNINASELSIKSDKYILYNIDEGNVLLEKESHEETYIASLTKIMTTIVALENIKDLNKKITITKDMLSGIDSDVTVVGFKVGEKVTYEDLLYGIILNSGADAVNALSISISGTKSKYVELMNNKVKELGLKNTHFTNGTGLYNKNNYSSAYDVAQILIYSLKNKTFKTIFETQYHIISTGKKLRTTIIRYNKKGMDLSMITGSKTGYIKKAGYCLASTATINDTNYLLITLNAMGGKTSHIVDAKNIYNYYKANYSNQEIVSMDEKIIDIKATDSENQIYTIRSNEVIKKYEKIGFDKNRVTFKYIGNESVSYFDKKNMELGIVKVYLDNEELQEMKVYYDGSLPINKKYRIVFNSIYIGRNIVFGLLLIYLLCICFHYKKQIINIDKKPIKL